ncbi:MAG: hypothetical protein AMXMBFR61_19620 [Fimbriimonadales bacterium]
MVVVQSEQRPFEEVAIEGACGAYIKELLTQREGAPNFAMRLFEIRPGGHTMHHSHAWEHEVFILSGTGEVRADAGPIAVKEGDAVLVPGGETHSFANTGTTPFRFLCMIPVEQPCCK